ncbi:alkylated DNA repair protein ALKBH8 homolog [Ziziphus jujuba]|uniref:Alkylated DNA repair protein ALKBH8 homolog n=1 Tax=Ziziphus jujuba TaxID=326968 RepID=A0A6P4AAZ2_ZIZJJ|nr:alkylated DNA repair protein ALKBH8 homolog [Ziziphus jujuba]
MDVDKALLVEVFGESSDGEDLEEEQSGFDNGSQPNYSWERIEEVKGLWLCTDFLSPQRQASLLSAIQDEGWFTEASYNQAMRFGDLPAWATELSASIRDVVLSSNNLDHGEDELCPFPLDLLWREPLFDQLIVNVYHPDEGICGHVDLMRFEDGIAIVSLESSCVMHFSSIEGTDSDIARTKVPVYLTPGSLVLMSGEARYQWKHEINRKPGFQKWEGEDIDQKRRTSVTLRKLRQIE